MKEKIKRLYAQEIKRLRAMGCSELMAINKAYAPVKEAIEPDCTSWMEAAIIVREVSKELEPKKKRRKR